MNAPFTAKPRMSVELAGGEKLDVRHASIQEGLNEITIVSLEAKSSNADMDFSASVGKKASFELVHQGATRKWTGVCADFRLLASEEKGVSRYELRIVPRLWLATQRRDYRIFQQQSELEIARSILKDWGIEPIEELDQTYKKRKFRVQYAESDFSMFRRVLEQAGITFFFREVDGETRLVLSDAPEETKARTPAIDYLAEPPRSSLYREHVTGVNVGEQLRPTRYTLRDHDQRRPRPLQASAAEDAGDPLLERLERFHFVPGAFAYRAASGDTPHADDRGAVRSDDREAQRLAERRLKAKRGDAKACSFMSNALDLSAGMVARIAGHPRQDVNDERGFLLLRTLLVMHAELEDGDSRVMCDAVSAKHRYVPPLVTPQPSVEGVQSATVVGPKGEEIHTDEFGRVRVQFHWDREGRFDERSSCWIAVSQPWGGAGYGGSNLPRVGQEVLVAFLGGDPDKPVVVGRLFNAMQKTPYTLPANKTQSGWRSCSSPSSGGYNEIMFEDAAGKELLRIRAERNLEKVVGKDESTTIKGSRSAVVQGDDEQRVRGVQKLSLGGRTLRLNGSEQSLVVGNVASHVQQGDRTYSTEGRFSSEAAEQVVICKQRFVVKVGERAWLVLTPDKAILEAPEVLIQPGPGAVGDALGRSKR